MNSNPLFPQNDTPAADKPANTDDAAVRLIRGKVARAFSEEPSAVQELAEVQAERTLSKHQRFMLELSGSGKSLAEIQTAWHYYYTTLPDPEKHEVWQEFYAANVNTPYQQLFQKRQSEKGSVVVQPTSAAWQSQPTTPSFTLPRFPTGERSGKPVVSITPSSNYEQLAEPDRETAQSIRQKIIGRVNAGGKLKVKHHLQSLFFGLATGSIVLVVLLFSFFNEYIIAPFIQPSRTVSSTPIILSDTATVASDIPQVLIPKINVQIPLVLNIPSNQESAIENALESGVAHYPSTVLPGQNGNTAFFGHSSNNIFNPGKYKFAFVLLRSLTTGDTFYLTYGGTVYAYQVFAREIVDPSQVGVLTDTKGKQATATLITCDPPGTTQKRLVVWGEQISPSLTSNVVASTTPVAAGSPKVLASNGPSLWSRLVSSITFWN